MRQSLEWLIKEYQKSLFNAAFNLCRNAEDANDVVQDAFIQYHTSNKQFSDEEHLRAWLFRVAINKAKDINRSFWRKNKASLEECSKEISFETPEEEFIFEEVMKLPEKYRIVIHLFYYEDMSIREIAEIFKISEGNTKMRLSRGRSLLRDVLKEEWNDDK